MINVRQCVFAVLILLSQMSIGQENISATRMLRIIGGEISQPGSWPWMAALVTRGKSVLEGQFCSGTLIRPNWVLTAAHCVDDAIYRTNIDVVFGVHNLRTDEGERVPVKEVVIHPDYQILDSDIALLELETAVTRTPINLAKSDSMLDTEGNMATVIGWGNTSEIKSRPAFLDELRQVSIPIVSNTKCSEVNPIFTITPNMLCAGLIEGGKDSCQGDSGGPLFIINEQNNNWTQVGIVSHGDNCAKPDSYGIYTRVSAFGDFIAEQSCALAAPVMALSVAEGKVVKISWSQITDATGYEIHYAPYPFGVPIQSLDVSDQTTYSVNLQTGKNYYVAIKAYNDICRSDFSNNDFFVIP